MPHGPAAHLLLPLGGDWVFATPASVTGLFCWYDASNAASFTLSGSDVTAWNDLSSNARHLNLVTGTPSRTGSQNGLTTVLVAAGESVHRAQTVPLGTGACTVFTVVKIDAVITGFVVTEGATGDDTNTFRPVESVITTGSFRFGERAGGADVFDADAVDITGAFKILRTTDTGTSVERAVDGVSTGAAFSHSLLNPVTNRFTLGALLRATPVFSTGTIEYAEVIAYNRVLEAADIVAVEAYLTDKWLTSSGTNAPAGNAAATGTANGATVKVATAAGHASATGSAGNAQTTIRSSAGLAAATGVANQPTAKDAPTAGHAAASGAASNATVTTGTLALAGHAAGTGAAHPATPKVSPTPTAATATGAAHAATVKVSTAVGHAAGSGAASSATAKVAPVAGSAAGTGAAFNATVTTSASTNANAGHAAATGAASSATAKIAPRGGHAAGVGQAHDATALTGSFTNAPAGLASGTGTANGVTVKVAPTAGLAAGVGGATAPLSGVTPRPGQAAASGQAFNASVAVAVSAAAAFATAVAFIVAARIAPTAGHASGTGTAYNGTVGEVILTLLRVLHVRAEDRTLTAVAEDRTLEILAAARTLLVEEP